MPINFYTVANHLESEGWTLISDSYKNLTTELEMRCPKGHIQKITYGQWRKNPVCDICLGNNGKKINKADVPEKSDKYRLLALDAATGITGYAIYDDDQLVGYGTFKANKDDPTEQRIDEMRLYLINAIKQWKPDFVGLENIQLQQFGHSFQVELYRALANLQGVLINTLYQYKIDHDLVYSSSWRKYCNVGDDKGRENKKKAAQDKVKTWYGVNCTQDEADAICIGKYFVNFLKNTKSSWGED